MKKNLIGALSYENWERFVNIRFFSALILIGSIILSFGTGSLLIEQNTKKQYSEMCEKTKTIILPLISEEIFQESDKRLISIACYLNFGNVKEKSQVPIEINCKEPSFRLSTVNDSITKCVLDIKKREVVGIDCEKFKE